jgi:hypothetical protein
VKIRTASYFDTQEILRSGLTVVGTSRARPRMRLPYTLHLWRAVAPEREWFNFLEDVFRDAYVGKLDDLGHACVLDRLAQFAADEGTEGVVLACFERLRHADESVWCHRRHLAQWLTRHTGAPVSELA